MAADEGRRECSTWWAAGRATTPACWDRCISGGWRERRRFRWWRPSSSPSTARRWGRMMWGCFVSQSGETKDVLNAIELAEEKGTGVLGSGECDRLDPDAGHRAPYPAGLRLRDQRASDQDLHQPGAGFPVSGTAHGRARYRYPVRCAGTDGEDDGCHGWPGGRIG